MTVMLTCVKQPAAMEIGGFMTGVLLVSLLLGCSRTVSEQGTIKQLQTGDAAATGFFGEDLSLLHPGTGEQAAMVNINPNAHWSNYNKIHARTGAILGQREQQRLANRSAHVDRVLL